MAILSLPHRRGRPGGAQRTLGPDGLAPSADSAAWDKSVHLSVSWLPLKVGIITVPISQGHCGDGVYPCKATERVPDTGAREGRFTHTHMHKHTLCLPTHPVTPTLVFFFFCIRKGNNKRRISESQVSRKPSAFWLPCDLVLSLG